MRIVDSATARYVLVGALNTAVGLSIIIFLQEAVAIDPVLANAAGYASGLTVSYLLNRRFAFRSQRSHIGGVPMFLAAAGVSYALNLLVLHAALEMVRLPAVLAQVASLATFTVSFYLFNRYAVFAEPRH